MGQSELLGAIVEGAVVILRDHRERGVFRVERLLDVAGVAHARLLSYRDGRFSVVPRAWLVACPAGVPAAGSP